MIPLLLFLLALAAVYVGTIETAFSALMRLSLRLMVERGGRDDRLGFYLEDPIRLFLPARLLLGLIFSLATMFIAILTGRTGIQAIGMLLLFVAVFILICEHVVPIFIVRRNPERVLEVLLPPFDVMATAVRPLTNSLTRLILEPRRERAEQGNGVNTNGEAQTGDPPAAGAEHDGEHEQGLIEEEGRKLLQSIVDFGDTLVREVMTPRPDMVAVAASATLAEVRERVPGAGVLAHPGVRREPRQHPRDPLREGPDPAPRRSRGRRAAARPAVAHPAGGVRARDQAGRRNCSRSSSGSRRSSRSSWTSTAAPPVSRRSKISSRRSSARSGTSTTSRSSRSSRRGTARTSSAAR